MSHNNEYEKKKNEYMTYSFDSIGGCTDHTHM